MPGIECSRQNSLFYINQKKNKKQNYVVLEKTMSKYLFMYINMRYIVYINV